jgi:hypothetical protein
MGRTYVNDEKDVRAIDVKNLFSHGATNIQNSDIPILSDNGPKKSFHVDALSYKFFISDSSSGYSPCIRCLKASHDNVSFALCKALSIDEKIPL